MLRTTLAAAAAAILAVPAAANPLGPFLQYTGQIRGQAALVQAQAELTFGACRRGPLLLDDVLDELNALERDLCRLELQLAQPVRTGSQVRRLQRLAERLDEHACQVEQEVHAALADARRHNRRHTSFRPQTFPAITVGHRNVRLMVGFGSSSLHGSAANTPVGSLTATPHYIAPSHRVAPTHGVVSERDAAVLCSQTETLHLMTRQLLALLN